MPQNYDFFHSDGGCCLLLRIVAYCCLVRPPAPRLFGMTFSSHARNFAVSPLSTFCRCRDTQPLPVPSGTGGRLRKINHKSLFLLRFRKNRSPSASNPRCHRSVDAVKETPPMLELPRPPQCDCVVAAVGEIGFFLVSALPVLCQWLASG